MQVSTHQNPKKIDITKELWFFLMFNCIGFTVWPLMIYYLSRTLNFSYFIDLNLRTWAEEIVYGPLGSISMRHFSSLALLFFPYFVFWLSGSYCCRKRFPAKIFLVFAKFGILTSIATSSS